VGKTVIGPDGRLSARSRRCRLGWSKSRGEPQRCEPPNSSTFFLLRIAFEEVVSAQLLEDCFGPGQEVIDHDQDGMGDGNGGRFVAPAGSQAMELGAEG
jgi:hypothetical protein